MDQGEQQSADLRLAALLRKSRDFYEVGQYQPVLQTFQEFGDISKVRSGFRVEAICYAARAYNKLGKPAQASALLKRLGRGDWTNATLFGHIAMVYLEMRDYEKARDFADRAAQIHHQATGAIQKKPAPVPVVSKYGPDAHSSVA